MLQGIVLFFHLTLALVLIGLVLLQHGKGADAGAAFGSGSSGTVFGSAGSATFLTKFTTLIAALFAVTSISLTIIATKSRPESLSDKLMQQETVTAPASAPAVTEVPVAPASTTSEHPAPEVPAVPQ